MVPEAVVRTGSLSIIDRVLYQLSYPGRKWHGAQVGCLQPSVLETDALTHLS